MCLKWTNGSNECSKSATDKMYIKCKVKAPYILLVQYVIKIIENTVQLLIFILKINRRSEKNPTPMYIHQMFKFYFAELSCKLIQCNLKIYIYIKGTFIALTASLGEYRK